ncbi:MAG: hypothetical protein ABH812_01175 [bacterium]
MENAKERRLKQFLEKTHNRAFSDKEVLQSKNKIISFFEILIQIDKRQRNNERYNRNTNSAN